MRHMKDVVIIGGGASGLFCAAAFAVNNSVNSVSKKLNGLILEKTDKVGTKLLMSGSGQCNLTHDGSIKEFPSAYGSNGNKIRSCLYKHSNVSLIRFMNENGIKTFTREDGKVFPESMKASDVLAMLKRKSSSNGFEIKTNSPVTDLRFITDKGLWEIHSGSEKYITKYVIIATGGCSYPTSGSDGSMFKILKKCLNLNITPLKPALSSIQVCDYPYNNLSGISFENSHITILQGVKNTNNTGKKIAETSESLLLTHADFSGPAILNISKYANTGDTLSINYVYPRTYEDVFSALKEAAHGSSSNIEGIISSITGLPKRFSASLVARYGNSLKKLAAKICGEEFEILSVSGFNRAMATSGGIELSQIKTSNMELKSHPGMFVIGEALDIDGITGGYNIQFAYSSANSAATYLKEIIF